MTRIRVRNVDLRDIEKLLQYAREAKIELDDILKSKMTFKERQQLAKIHLILEQIVQFSENLWFNHPVPMPAWRDEIKPIRMDHTQIWTTKPKGK